MLSTSSFPRAHAPCVQRRSQDKKQIRVIKQDKIGSDSISSSDNLCKSITISTYNNTNRRMRG